MVAPPRLRERRGVRRRRPARERIRRCGRPPGHRSLPLTNGPRPGSRRPDRRPTATKDGPAGYLAFMATLFAGTSGFAYPAWKPEFYPADVSAAHFLEHYAARLNCVEINYTFRRTPRATTLEAWAQSTAPGFTFAVKAHQRITHGARLQDAGEATAFFLKALEPLQAAGKLGPILFQLPPWLHRDVRACPPFSSCCRPGSARPSSSVTSRGSPTRSSSCCAATGSPSAWPTPRSSSFPRWSPPTSSTSACGSPPTQTTTLPPSPRVPGGCWPPASTATSCSSTRTPPPGRSRPSGCCRPLRGGAALDADRPPKAA